jgi:bifunctional UDP-N-acetylglucosamine pyrophosphorylase/glucosamine-1-phosphate N-acetyltransferase
VTTTAIILAAGLGTRMKSATPKVLHRLAGRPLVHYPVRAALDAGCDRVVVVVGHGREEVTRYLAGAFGDRVRAAVQEQQRGTGDAARAGLVAVEEGAGRVLVFYGDVPLVTAEDLRRVTSRLDEPGGDVAIATCVLDDPHGYGRILRDAAGHVVEIREEKDLQSDAQRAVTEINPGIYATTRERLAAALGALKAENAQGELYLTDIAAIAMSQGHRVATVPSRPEVLVGINDREQLHRAEERMHDRIATAHRRAGVTVRAGALIDDGVEIGAESIVEHGAVLRGKTRIGRHVKIDVGCVLDDVVVEDGAVLKPYSVLSQSIVRGRAQVGPFSHLRPGSDIGEEAHVGNFVETKNTRLGKASKANHLAYLGDGVIGEAANVGAGTIFCNYDGFQKHTTVIEDGAFIGSDSQIVAPVTIGAGAYVATGTTVTQNVPANALAIARVRQDNKIDYASKLRARLKAAKEAAGGKP